MGIFPAGALQPLPSASGRSLASEVRASISVSVTLPAGARVMVATHTEWYRPQFLAGKGDIVTSISLYF